MISNLIFDTTDRFIIHFDDQLLFIMNSYQIDKIEKVKKRKKK